MSWYSAALESWYRSKMQSADAMAQGIESLGQSVGKAIQGVRQNAVANQYANTLNPPRAELVSPGVNPESGAPNAIGANVPTGGTAPATGGVQGLQYAMALEQLKNQRGNLASEMALRKAETGYYKAHTGTIRQNAARLAKHENAYEEYLKSKNPANVSSELRALNSQYGANVIKALGTHGGARGSIQNGVWVGDPNGPMWSPADAAQNYTSAPTADAVKPVFPFEQVQAIKQRLDAINAAPIGRMSAGDNGAGQPGSLAPVQIASREEYDQLPSGTRYMDPNGAIGTKP